MIMDIEMSHKIGCRTVMVKTGKRLSQLADQAHWKIKPDYIASDLFEAIDLISRLDSPKK